MAIGWIRVLAALETQVSTELDAILAGLPTRERMLAVVERDIAARELRHLLAAHGDQVPAPPPITAARRIARAISLLGSDLDVALRTRPRGPAPAWAHDAGRLRELQGVAQ